MSLAEDIDLLVSRRPGLTELGLAKTLFGRRSYQQRINSTCRRLVRECRVERRGTGGPGHPFTYYSSSNSRSLTKQTAISLADLVHRRQPK